MSGIERIAAERQRQINKEGWTPEHDDQHDSGELAMAAVCYAAPKQVRMKAEVPVNCGCREAMCPHSNMSKTAWLDPWPWDSEWDKRKKHDRIRQLEIAGALIAAEIDRLERAQPPREGKE
jgi:hypothetical protein